MHEQKIYFGAPGTGKSFLIDKLLTEEGITQDKIFRIVIHPEYTYSDFVGQILPVNKVCENGENKLDFEFKAGPFTRALVEAYKDSSKNVYLVIEELSRGNVAAIFGDIFQLLDRNPHFESRYPIDNKNVAEKIDSLVGYNIKLPSNFNILCTVNTNDQNVFPMDTAFKRRFQWEYVSTKSVPEKNNPKIHLIKEGGNIETDWISFYEKLNKYIINVMNKNEDRQIGQFFIEFNDKLIEDSKTEDEDTRKKAEGIINKLIKNKLLLYLWQDVQNGKIYNNQNNLFDENIRSYEDLYENYSKYPVFNKEFLNNYLNDNNS